jgi:hypothetical protein
VLESLNDLIVIAIKIDNRYYKRAMERKGLYTGHQNRSNRKSYRSDLIELNMAQKFKLKLSKEVISQRREKGLCFEYRLPGHQVASHRKKGVKKP